MSAQTVDLSSWRAAAADDADRVATRADAYVDDERRHAVRLAVRLLAAPAQERPAPRKAAARRAVVMRLMVESLTRQARIVGIGDVHLPVCMACGSTVCRVRGPVVARGGVR